MFGVFCPFYWLGACFLSSLMVGSVMKEAAPTLMFIGLFELPSKDYTLSSSSSDVSESVCERVTSSPKMLCLSQATSFLLSK